MYSIFGARHTRTQVLSGEQNVEKYAAYFTKQEEENFALFNYVNELSYEVEVLNEAVQRVQDDIGNNHFNCCIFRSRWRRERCNASSSLLFFFFHYQTVIILY